MKYSPSACLLSTLLALVLPTQAATFDRALDLSPASLSANPVPDAMFGANIGYWSQVNSPALAASAQEAGLTIFRYHPGTYNDPHTVPGSINQWDFTAVDAYGAQRLADFGRFLIATGTTGQIHVNYGAGSIEQAAALLAYLCVPTDAPSSILGRSLGSSVLEPSIISPFTRTRDWRSVGFWVNLRASAPLAVDDGFNKLRLNHPTPFPVKYFECGNEADYSFVPCLRYRLPGENSITQGATGYGGRRADAHTYANFYAALKSLFREIHPDAMVGASAGYFEQSENDTDSPAVPYLFPGPSGSTKAWTPVMLTRLRELGVTPDFIVAHRYTQQTDFAWNNNYLLRGALNAYLAPGQGHLPKIHVTEINWAENESIPYTTTVNNAVNLARSFGDALQNDVHNLCWFTFTSGSANYNSGSTTGWRKYHNWGLIADDPLASPNPNADTLNWPGMFAGTRFPTFHAFALLKDFVRPGDSIYQASALSPANINSHDVTVFAAKRSTGAVSLLILNKADATHTLNLSLNGLDLGGYETTLSGSRYGKAQDEEQRLKSLQNPPILTNNTRESFTLSRSGQTLAFPVPPLSISMLHLQPLPTMPPSIASPPAAEGVAGLPFTHTVSASGGSINYTVGPLPAGLGFDPITATLSGNPTHPGDYTIPFTATNTAGSSTQNFKLSVRDQIPQSIYQENFAATSAWWSYHGDSGVTGILSQPSTAGPSGGSALQHDITVAAPPATYWYAGVGTNLVLPPGLAASTLGEYRVSLQIWSGRVDESSFDVVFKTAQNQNLTKTVAIPGQTWQPIAFTLAEATNQNFNFSAANMEVIVQPASASWPLASATYRIANVSLDRSVASDTAAQAWRRHHFNTILLSGEAAWTADPDGDSVENLLEYALGGIPTLPSSPQMPTLGFAGIGPQPTHLTFTFQRIADPMLTYEAWASEDLADWGVAPIWSSTGAQNTPGEITVTDPINSTNSTRRFLRLLVRLNQSP